MLNLKGVEIHSSDGVELITLYQYSNASHRHPSTCKAKLRAAAAGAGAALVAALAGRAGAGAFAGPGRSRLRAFGARDHQGLLQRHVQGGEDREIGLVPLAYERHIVVTGIGRELNVQTHSLARLQRCGPSQHPILVDRGRGGQLGAGVEASKRRTRGQLHAEGQGFQVGLHVLRGSLVRERLVDHGPGTGG